MAVGGAFRVCVLVLSVLVGACSVHDPDRLKPLSLQGGTASQGSGGNGGQAGGGTGGTGGTGGAGTGGAGAGGMGGDASVDPDAGEPVRCGDGLVTGSELCDTAIEEGEPGACPSECPPLSECVMRARNGTGCRAECVVLQAQCADGDGCCPGNCMPSNDDDCSSSCGDGIVQEGQGETCEPEPNADAGVDAGPAVPCPEDCDDGDPCTTDVLSGSAMNCNVECTRVEITALASGDGCCPDGANMLTDTDCMPRCGNGVRERGEDCDGAGCNQSCDLDYTADQRQCLDTFAITNEACDLCLCTQCAQEKLGCFADTNESRGELCVTLQACVRASGCFDSSCYCGSSASCLAPNGPCIPQVELAAETDNPFDLDARKMDTNYAIGRSYALDVCRVNQCDSVCD